MTCELQERVESIRHSGGLWQRFKVGQVVQVSQEKFEGLATILEEPKSPEDRVRVLLEFMGRQVRAIVPWTSLNPALKTATAVPLRRRDRRTRGKGRWINGHNPSPTAQT